MAKLFTMHYLLGLFYRCFGQLTALSSAECCSCRRNSAASIGGGYDSTMWFITTCWPPEHAAIHYLCKSAAQWPCCHVWNQFSMSHN